jgi:hypothetical protein
VAGASISSTHNRISLTYCLDQAFNIFARASRPIIPYSDISASLSTNMMINGVDKSILYRAKIVVKYTPAKGTLSAAYILGRPDCEQESVESFGTEIEALESLLSVLVLPGQEEVVAGGVGGGGGGRSEGEGEDEGGQMSGDGEEMKEDEKMGSGGGVDLGLPIRLR